MSFSTTISNWSTASTEKIERIRRAIGLKLISAIIMDTPVKSGRARASWQTSLNSPITSEVDRTNVEEALSNLREVLEEVKGDDTIFVRSNLPYIIRLEFESWSKQAPAGMVRKNALRFVNLVNQAIKEGKL
jgi:hypothetical protein